MRQHKTALVLRLAALAISIPLVPAARAADDLAVAELTVAEQTIAVEEAIVREEIAAEEAIVREETAAAVDTIAEEEKLHWREVGLGSRSFDPSTRLLDERRARRTRHTGPGFLDSGFFCRHDHRHRVIL